MAVILVSMGLRQTFGLFFSAFEEGLNCTRTEFGLAIGIQMLFWGLFAPIFGLLQISLVEVKLFLLVLLFLVLEFICFIQDPILEFIFK